MYFDSNPVSTNLAAKAHGRLDFVFLIAIKTMLVLLFEAAAVVGRWVLVAAILATGLIWIGGYMVRDFHSDNKVETLLDGLSLTRRLLSR